MVSYNYNKVCFHFPLIFTLPTTVISGPPNVPLLMYILSVQQTNKLVTCQPQLGVAIQCFFSVTAVFSAKYSVTRVYYACLSVTAFVITYQLIVSTANDKDCKYQEQ